MVKQTIHVNELEKLIADHGPFKWLNPECVEGIDSVEVKEINRRKWFRYHEFPEDFEGPDEIVTDYLRACLFERSWILERKQTLPPELYIDAVKVVNASIYLMCELGSSYAGYLLSFSSTSELMTEENVQTCLDLVAAAYENSTGFIRDILRDYILDTFRYGPLWQLEGGSFTHALRSEQNDFLKRVFEQGYATIDPQDARLFVDGSKRW